ncbi:hypothetical protein GQS65_04235 [Halomarina oriensis]|uniref:Uncharacterized protein n=2 Tax=Halomarina oriensis TaxID=671145 RepID=A0A6B0GPY5_9EURY|nr:hypothetical protein [Halomarina oriensis]
MGDQTEKTGRFLVTHAEDDSAVLKDVDDSQVHTLAENPGVEAGDVLDATVRAVPPMGVSWSVVAVDERRSLRVERSEEPPTARERDLAATQETGEVKREERAGMGEIHVISVPDERTDEAVDDVLDDEATLVRAARMDDVVRVEVRTEPGVVAVRYLP